MAEFMCLQPCIQPALLLVEHTEDGSLHYLFIDWRHIEELLAACRDIYSSLMNICVWVKNGPGLGSLYRSQHEFVVVLKNGTLEIGILQTGSYNIENVDRLPARQQDHTR